MANDEHNALRLLLREEINAAVYASEQRMGSRFDRLDDRIGRLDERVDRLEGGQRELQANFIELKVALSQVISVLDDATRVINEFQGNQRALELKVEENTLALRRDVQRIEKTVQNFARHFIDMNQMTNDRISVHERMRIEETHPYLPYSTSTE